MQDPPSCPPFSFSRSEGARPPNSRARRAPFLSRPISSDFPFLAPLPLADAEAYACIAGCALGATMPFHAFPGCTPARERGTQPASRPFFFC